MAVFKRADRGNLFAESTNIELSDGVLFSGKDKYYRSLGVKSAGPLLDKEGIIIEDLMLKTGQKGTLHLGKLSLGQYHVLIEPNPKLSIKCQIRGPRLLEPREDVELEFALKADSITSLNDFDYLFRLYIID